MKVIVDTNIVVSSSLRAGKPRKIIAAILEQPYIDWIISEEIKAEYEEVICRPKFNLPADVIEDWFRIFSTLHLVDDSNIDVDFPRDRKDEKFHRCCIAVNADYFVTGDGDFRGIEKIGDTTVISASDFWKLLDHGN
jgi:putative PIN family toxin of toxin-antitoxin system